MVTEVGPHESSLTLPWVALALKTALCMLYWTHTSLRCPRAAPSLHPEYLSILFSLSSIICLRHPDDNSALPSGLAPPAQPCPPFWVGQAPVARCTNAPHHRSDCWWGRGSVWVDNFSLKIRFALSCLHSWAAGLVCCLCCVDMCTALSCILLHPSTIFIPQRNSSATLASPSADRSRRHVCT